MRIASSCALVLLLAGLTGPTGQGLAQTMTDEVGVSVELVLAVDTSRSINRTEQMIQRRGYASAFRSAEIQEAILYSGWGRVAVTYVEWAGERSQTIMIPWTLIDSQEAAEAFATLVEAGPISSISRTSISGAIDFTAGMFQGNGFAGSRRVIDISGDGPNNQGRMVTEARDAAVARGIIINGLPLLTNVANERPGSWGSIPDLDQYYVNCVIGGPGAFSIAVTNWDQFASAIRQKLVLELAGSPVDARAELIRVQARPPSDCLVGERMWEQRWRD